jgi:protein-S-isoprenylcysteine O-methyltransferase Ste14
MAASGFELRIPPLLLTAAIAAAMAAVAALVPQLTVVWPGRGLLAALIGALGAGIALLGVVEFRRAATSVNPMRSDGVRRVVTSGIYRVSRNPMYLGFALALAAWAVWLSNALALAGVPLLVAYLNRFQIGPEERLLRERFGCEYDGYVATVRRWLGRG